MPQEMPNRKDELELVREVVSKANRYAFDDIMVDLRLCNRRIKNREFMEMYRFHTTDIRQALFRLSVRNYCHTVPETQKPDAYVFNPIIDNIEVYLKISIEDEIVVISFHEPECSLSNPYKDEC